MLLLSPSPSTIYDEFVGEFLDTVIKAVTINDLASEKVKDRNGCQRFGC
jgi:hypothetical protein